MDRTYRDANAGRNGANRLAAIASSQDRRTFVVVHDSGAAADVAALAGGIETVAGFAHDIAAPVFGQSLCEVEDQRPLGVLAGRDAVEHFDPESALEKVR